MSKTKYRMVRLDQRNWSVQRFQEGGQRISRGRHAGKLTTAKWDAVNPVGYYPNLVYACKSMLDVLLRDGYEDTDENVVDLKRVPVLIAEAEKRIAAMAAAYAEDPKENQGELD